MPVIIIDDGDQGLAVSLAGMHVTNGYENAGSLSGCINVKGNVVLTLSESLIDHNTGKLGGGIYLGGQTAASLLDVMVVNNQAIGPLGGDGGGIFCDGCSMVVAGRSGVSNNTAERDGGGIYLDSGSSLLFTSGSVTPETDQQGIHQNNSGVSGGGIYAIDSEVYLYGFAINETIGNSSEPVNITNNYALEQGGGLFADNTSISALAFDISQNQSKYSGGMFLYGNSYLLVDGQALSEEGVCWHAQVNQCNRFMNNISTEVYGAGGGALNIKYSSASISNVWFQGNIGSSSAIESDASVSPRYIEISNTVFFQNWHQSNAISFNVIEASGVMNLSMKHVSMIEGFTPILRTHLKRLLLTITEVFYANSKKVFQRI